MDWVARPECKAAFNTVLAALKQSKTFAEKPAETQYCEAGAAIRAELFRGFKEENWVHVTEDEFVAMTKDMTTMMRLAAFTKKGKHNTAMHPDKCTDCSEDPVQQLLEAGDDGFAKLALEHREKRQKLSTKTCAECFLTLEHHWLTPDKPSETMCRDVSVKQEASQM